MSELTSSESGPQALAGPMIIAYSFNWALLGVLSLQVYLYHILFPLDSRLLKGLVYGIFICEWFQTALLTECAFKIFVYNFGNAKELTTTCSAWFCLVVMAATISVVVQFFFAWRIYVLSQIGTIAGGLVILSLIQGSFGVTGGVMMRELSSTADILRDRTLLGVITVWLVFGAIADVIIAVTMTLLLTRMKTGIRETDTLVNRLVRLVIETGALTATVAMVGLVLLFAFPEAQYYEPPVFCFSKMYSNTFLTNLLNRALLNDQLRRVQDNRGLDNISAASILAPGAFQGARNNSTMYWELERSNPVPTCTVRGDSDLGGPLEDWATSSDVHVRRPRLSI